PRRQHETAAIKANKPPNDMAIIPGVIDSKSNFVEHPEVVAQRIEAVVAAIGDKERVIAGVDCGFGTFVGWEWVAEDVAWAKLKTLSEGAAIASKRLWGESARSHIPIAAMSALGRFADTCDRVGKVGFTPIGRHCCRMRSARRFVRTVRTCDF